jgi:cation diffusion facilitator family transporter
MSNSYEPEAVVHRVLYSSLLSIATNFLLAVCKCVAGLLGHSFALVADGIESLSDVFSSAAVYFGLQFAIKPPDRDHPYGHGKAEPVAAVAVGIGMAIAGFAIAIESISLIRTPHPLPMAYTLWVLLAVVGVKLSISRYVSAVARELKSTAVQGDAWYHLSDAMTSAFAFIGISVAILSRNPSADDWAALCASPVILLNAFRQIRLPLAEIMDTAPPPDIEHQVRSVAAAVPGVLGLEKCFVRKVGFRYYVDLHVVVDGDLTARGGHSLSHQVEDQVLAEVPLVAKVLVHVEPEEELLNPSQSEM